MPLPTDHVSPRPPFDPRLVLRFQAFSHVVAWATLASGVMALVAQAFHAPAVAGVMTGMRPMTAAGLVIAALTLLTARRETPRWNLVCLALSVGLFVIGTLSIADRLGLTHLGLGDCVLRVSRDMLTPYGPLVAGIAFILISLRATAFCLCKNHLFGELLSVVLLATSMIALAALGVSFAHGPECTFSAASPLTAALLFSNSLAWIALRPTSPLGVVTVKRGAGGLVARWLLLPALLIPLIWAWLLQWAHGYLGISATSLISISALVTGASVAILVWVTSLLSERLERQNITLLMLNDAASKDALTGLYNRRTFDSALAHQLQIYRDDGRVFSLLMLDLDRFKNYNDSFGHPAGDEVLRRVGALLHRNVRPADLAARYGGEEFVVLLASTSEQAAMQTAERIRSAFFSENWPHRAVTVSIGVAQATNEDSAESLIHRADTALYAAKQQGRNRVTSAHNLSTPVLSSR